MANQILLKRASGSDPTASDLALGEIAIRTDNGKLFTKKDNGTVAEISGAGGGNNFSINTLSSSSGSGGGSASFNGTATRFTLSNPPNIAAQLLVSINGVIQKPNTGTSPSEGFAVDGNDIIFSSAPDSGADFFILTYASLAIAEPSDNTVTSAKIVDGAIVNADINASAAIAGTKISPDFGSQNITTTGNLGVGVAATSTEFLFIQTPSGSSGNNTTKGGLRIKDGSFANGALIECQDSLGGTVFKVGGDLVTTSSHLDVGAGLDVTGNITATGDLTVSGGDITLNGTGCLLNFNDTNNNPDFRIQVEAGNFLIEDATNSFADRFVISSSGNIGINNNNPQTSLDVTGAITGTGNLTIDTSAFFVNASNNFIGIGTATPTDTAGSGHCVDIKGGSSGTAIYLRDSSNNTGQIDFSNSNMTIRTRQATPILFNVNNSERMRINSSGLVGIGTNNPLRKIHVTTDNTPCAMFGGTGGGDNFAIEIGQLGTSSSAGFNAIGTNGSMLFQIAGSEKMRIDTSGRLLLGTTTEGHSTADDLTVATSGHTGISIRSGSSNNGNIYFSDGTSGNAELAGYIQYSHSSNHMLFGTNESNAMLIDSSGNVGIGTTSPNRLLYVNKSSTVSYNSSAEGGGDNHLLRIHNPNGTDNTGVNNHTGLEFIVSSGANSIGQVGLVRTGNNQGDMFFKFRTAGNSYGEKLRIQNGGGISFNGDTAAANALNDYEEGNFTPTLPNGGGSVSFTTHTAKYIKIGNVVHIQCDISSIANHQNSDLLIGGFPFTSSSVNATTSTLLTGRSDPGNGLTVNVFDSSAFAGVRSQFNSDGQKGLIFNGHGLHFNLTYVTN